MFQGLAALQAQARLFCGSKLCNNLLKGLHGLASLGWHREQRWYLSLGLHLLCFPWLPVLVSPRLTFGSLREGQKEKHRASSRLQKKASSWAKPESISETAGGPLIPAHPWWLVQCRGWPV